MSDSTDQRPSKVPRLSSSDISTSAHPPGGGEESSIDFIQPPPVESEESVTAPQVPQPQTISTSSGKRKYTCNSQLDDRNQLLGEYVQKLQVPRWCIDDLNLEELSIPDSESHKKLSARKHYFDTIAPNFLGHPSIFYSTHNRKEVVEIAYKDAAHLLGIGGYDNHGHLNLEPASPASPAALSKLQQCRPKGEYLQRFQSLSKFLSLQLKNPSINRTDLAYIVAKIETGAATGLNDHDRLTLTSEDYNSKELANIVLRLKQDEDAWVMRRHIPQKVEGWNRKRFPRHNYEQPLSIRDKLTPEAGMLKEPKPRKPIRRSADGSKIADDNEKDLEGDKETKKMGRSTRLELTKTIYLSDDEDENGFQHLNI
ncbi:Protein of unknown function [Pyronema omphalodes CBS 100304]|uniref:Uncharacterized protein n=1 Tax=Pyronema omphalodes (strain CBS 100304) TaxID=1076935 RepID=U4LGS0_PYROM|nr:Protein of unknown function [Pyronema omphalodes CBS 100304]